MKTEELVKQSSLIISSLAERLNNSEDWMSSENWEITKEEVEAFCSYYGALPTEVNEDILASFHQKMRIYYLTSKACTPNISPYFTSDGELISKFEEERKKINNKTTTNLNLNNLYNEAINDLNNAKNLETVVFIYEIFLPIDLQTTDELLKKQLLEVKSKFEKTLTNKSQIENAKKTLFFLALTKQDNKFTKELRALYKNDFNIEV